MQLNTACGGGYIQLLANRCIFCIKTDHNAYIAQPQVLTRNLVFVFVQNALFKNMRPILRIENYSGALIPYFVTPKDPVKSAWFSFSSKTQTILRLVQYGFFTDGTESKLICRALREGEQVTSQLGKTGFHLVSNCHSKVIFNDVIQLLWIYLFF